MRSLVKLTIAALPAGLILLGAAGSPPNPDSGRRLFEKMCTGCHALDHAKAGPRLRAVFGRPAGRDPEFPYSDALKRSRVVWDEAALDKWLADPDRAIPDNDMSFRLDNAAERADIIAYLKQVGGK